MAMNSDPILQSTTTQSQIIMHSAEETEATSVAELIESNSIITGEIRPEYPIAIDTVYRAISVYLDSADLMSCSQVWSNCHWITEEIFKQTDNLTLRSLHILKSELAKAITVQSIGHLTLQYFGSAYEDIKLATKHPKLKYLHQLTFDYERPGYFNSNNFHYLMRRIGQRLQTLCIKVPYLYFHSSGHNGLHAGKGQKKLLFPVYKNNQGPPELLEFKNMKRFQIYCHDMEIGFGISITGIALTMPNLVELYLKGVFAKNITDDLVPTIPTKQVKPATFRGRPPSEQLQPQPPRLPSLRKLSIIYKHVQASRAKTQLTVLTAMELQLRHLELVNVSCYANAEIIMDFLETQEKTLEVLKLTTTWNVFSGPLSLPGKLPKFFLPGTFLKLEEITLGEVFINDKFKETLKSIPNATKITCQLLQTETWGSILQRTNLTQSDQQPQSTAKVNIATKKTKNPKILQLNPKTMPLKKPTTPTTHNNIKEIYITGQELLVSESSLTELKQIFPNCVNISFNSSNIE